MCEKGVGGEGEGADVALEEGDGGVGGDVWGALGGRRLEERVSRVAWSVEGEFAVDVEEGLDEPVAEEAGSAGDEDAGSGEGGKDVGGVEEDVVEIRRGEWPGWHRCRP